LSPRTTVLTSALPAAVAVVSCGGGAKEKVLSFAEAGAAGEAPSGGSGNAGGSAGVAGSEVPGPGAGEGSQTRTQAGAGSEAGAPPVVVVPPPPPLVLFTVSSDVFSVFSYPLTTEPQVIE
jgi:hypothetical protein